MPSHPVINVLFCPASRWGQSGFRAGSEKSWKVLGPPRIVSEGLPIGLPAREVSDVPGGFERSKPTFF